MSYLLTLIEKMPNVGPKFMTRLKKLGIKTVRDLLWHFPQRYEDYSKIVAISDIQNSGQAASIVGRVTDIDVARSWRRRMAIINATIEDHSGEIRAVWFNQPFIADTLGVGTLVSLSGKISSDRNGLYLSSPSYEKISSAEDSSSIHTGRLVPIYPETEGVTSKYLRFLISRILPQVRNIADPLPREIVKKYQFPNLGPALSDIHFPAELNLAERARDRFSFEEMLLFQLRILHDHKRLQALKAPQISFDKELIASLVKTLPFKLTDDQRVAAYEILQDLEKPFPMNRLLNGDVGSGKTIVALIASYQAAHASYQAVFMAPTEILAKQHYSTMKSILAHHPNIKIGLLIGSGAKQWPVDEITEEGVNKKVMHKKIAEGSINIIVGTHAVIQKNIKFKKLGLVIIDEQHRFGIEHRMSLAKRRVADGDKEGLVPHLLSMTATPIPRTLALTIYGDLDVSLLKEKPNGRQKIITKVISDKKRGGAHGFIDKQIVNGRQVFVICPRIEASASDSKSETARSAISSVWADVKAVEEEYKKLNESVFPHRRVAMLHGKMKAKEKEEIMRKFRDGHFDILVSTSVIEVGVDIQNATIMMIESAERFGLAQLHQFRGRVGRGVHQSYCFLFTTGKDVSATQRLKAMENIDDGFKLAEADLQIRGPGEFGGVKQSGMPDLVMATLTDIDLIKKARLEARTILKSDPLLKKNPLLKERMEDFQKLTHFE